MHKKLILLVNADPATEAVVRAATVAGGRRLEAAANCAEAFQAAAKHIRDLALIILDLDKPGAVPLLAAFGTAHLPTVTTTSAREAAAAALKHGALGCCSKPVTSDWVKQALDYLVPVAPPRPLSLAA